MSELRHRLFPVPSGISCGVAAVCGVTGKSLRRVIPTMIAAANEDGEHPTEEYLRRKDSAFRHQLRSLEKFGYELFFFQGTPVTLANVPMNPIVDRQRLMQAPRVPDFLATESFADVAFCYAVREDEQERHSFAMDRGYFIDANTGGKVVRCHEAPAFLLNFRVTDLVLVRRKSSYFARFWRSAKEAIGRLSFTHTK